MELAGRGMSPERLLDIVARLQRRKSRIVSSAYTATAADDVILVDTSGGNVTITLPDAREHAGFWITVVKEAAANTLTVQRSGSDLINTAVSDAWTTRWLSKTFAATVVTLPQTYGWRIV